MSGLFNADFSCTVMPSNGEEESSGDASVDCTEKLGIKGLNLQGEQDYISDLPDSIIHHILSFLPSTKEAIRTGLLSKRWKHQWTRVPVLIFDFHNESYKNFSIENTLFLYDCSKIKKFKYCTTEYIEPQLSSVIHFATKRNVEELILYWFSAGRSMLPEIVFNNASLVRLELLDFKFKPSERVNWGCLKAMNLECCSLSNKGIENALSGSPFLETLDLGFCDCRNKLIVASKSLKELILRELYTRVTEISCPNLQKLKCEDGMLCGQVIQNISSGSPLLETLQLSFCQVFGLKQLAIASKSLKRLVVEYFSLHTDDGIKIKLEELKVFEIFCPKLEELELLGWSDFLPCAVMNLPSLLCATLDLSMHPNSSTSVAENILQQLQHVKELTIQRRFSEFLSKTELASLSSPMLNNSLTMEVVRLDWYYPNIVWALQHFHVLEKLVVKLFPDIYYAGENYWDSYKIDFHCLLAHLKIVKIIGLSKKNWQCKPVLGFVEFLLKNAKELHKLAVISKDGETDFKTEVYEKLSSFEKCSKHVVVELSHDTSIVPFEEDYSLIWKIY